MAKKEHFHKTNGISWVCAVENKALTIHAVDQSADGRLMWVGKEIHAPVLLAVLLIRYMYMDMYMHVMEPKIYMYSTANIELN